MSKLQSFIQCRCRGIHYWRVRKMAHVCPNSYWIEGHSFAMLKHPESGFSNHFETRTLYNLSFHLFEEWRTFVSPRGSFNVYKPGHPESIKHLLKSTHAEKRNLWMVGVTWVSVWWQHCLHSDISMPRATVRPLANFGLAPFHRA